MKMKNKKISIILLKMVLVVSVLIFPLYSLKYPELSKFEVFLDLWYFAVAAIVSFILIDKIQVN